MQKSTLIISRETKHIDRKNLWQTNLIITFTSVILLVFYKMMTIRWRFTGGKTPTYLKEKYHRSFIYGNSARTKLKSLFPPLKCSHLQPGFCQIHNSSQFGPEKTFSFCSWGYCANKTLFFKAGKLCRGHQCRCETQRALKSFSYGSRSSSSDTMLPVITIVLTTDLTESLEILGRLGLELGQEIRCKILEGSCKSPRFSWKPEGPSTSSQ